MDWLHKADKNVLIDWIKRNDLAMLASLEDGTILYANESLLRRLQYTLAELVGFEKDGQRHGGQSWFDLTVQNGDLEAHKEAARRLKEGQETQYWVLKHYRAKNGAELQVLLHVLRFPHAGDFELCLVTAFFLDAITDMVMQTQLDEMSVEMRAAMEDLKKALAGQSQHSAKDDIERLGLYLIRVWKRYPKLTWTIVGGVLAAILGREWVTGLIQRIISP